MCSSWQALLEPEIQNFLKEHENADVAALALKYKVDPIVLDQIKVRQKARFKSADFFDADGFIFPPNETYEQASSRACAVYKASLVTGETFVDLTAGSGADAFHISKRFDQSVFVEKDVQCASLLEHNSSALGLKNIDVKQGNAEDIIDQIYPVDFIYIDPQRRENSKRGLYDFSACSPDVISMLPKLKAKAHRVMVKASPFLDIEKGIDDLSPVHEVHVVEWDGQCKEVLYLLNFARETDKNDVVIRCVSLSDKGLVNARFSFSFSEEKDACAEYSMPLNYLYEPGPAFMKAGGFQSIAQYYGLFKLHKHTHLYTSHKKIKDFPGKIYDVCGVYPYKPKVLPVSSADIAIRNFPADVKAVRKKLSLKDGGDHRVYATTLSDGKTALVLCHR